MTDTFSKIADYKINSQKSVALLCISNKQTEKEIRETTCFIISSNYIKYIWIQAHGRLYNIQPKAIEERH